MLLCWPVISLQVLCIYCWHWHQTSRDGMDWGSPAPRTLNLSSPAWQACGQSCPSPSLTDEPSQPPVAPWSKRQTPGSIPVSLCWFTRFNWPFQALSFDWEDQWKNYLCFRILYVTVPWAVRALHDISQAGVYTFAKATWLRSVKIKPLLIASFNSEEKIAQDKTGRKGQGGSPYPNSC